jgi:hypothetical protein
MNKTLPQEVEVLPTLEMSEVPQEFQVKIRASFGDLMHQADVLVTKAREVAAMGESTDQEKQARETRLALVKVRTSAEKTHKDMKQDILVQGRAIDGAKNIVIAATHPSEKDMKAIEDRAELRAQEERDRLHADRYAELNQFTTAYNTLSLGRLTAEEYAAMLDNSKLAHEARIAREEREKAEREAAAKAEEEERQRIAAERVEAEKKAAADRAELEAKAKREEAARKEAEAVIAKQQAEAETARKAAAAALAKQQAEAEAKLAAERKSAAAELEKAKAEAARLAKIESDRLAAARADSEAKKQAEKKAAIAPDKVKIAEYAKEILGVRLPTGSTDDGKAACAKISKVIETALAEIRSIYTTLK